MGRKIFLPLISIGLLAFAIMHVVKAAQTPPKPEPLVEPARNPFTKGTIAGTGVIEPRTENIAVGSHLPGVVAEVYVYVGDRIKQGQKLFRLDDRQLKAEWNVRKAQLASAQANYDKLMNTPRPEEVPPMEARVQEMKASVANAKDLYQRAQQLLKTRAIGEEETMQKMHQVQMAEAQLAKAEADLKLMKKGSWIYDRSIAKVAVQQAQAMLEQTETELKRIEVLAPVDGTILQKNIRPGEYVGTNPGIALLVVGDTEVLHVRVDIDENDLARFRPGLKGVATRRGETKEEIPLKFVRVEPYVIPKRALTGAGTERVDTRVLQVIYAIDRTDLPLFVGQQLDVYLGE